MASNGCQWWPLVVIYVYGYLMMVNDMYMAFNAGIGRVHVTIDSVSNTDGQCAQDVMWYSGIWWGLSCIICYVWNDV